MKIKDNTIFCSVASFRDKICNDTLKSIYENARYPKNVYVGICQQNKEEDNDCKINFEDNPNVRIIRIPHYEARGPVLARYLCASLWDGEEYFLQIDSHMKFVKDWDIICIDAIKELKKIGVKKPVISYYPREYTDIENMTEKDKHMVPRICKSFFNSRDMISYLGPEILDTKDQFYQVPFVTGGFFFCESKFLQEVPYDPNLPYLFVGEEILHSIRFYTNGWDIYSPKENIVFHYYTRKDEPKVWTDNKDYKDSDALEKVKYYIKFVNDDSKLSPSMKINLDKYGLGQERSLDDFYNFAGIDVENKKVTKNFCRENNEATEEDITKSNEKNWVVEGFKILNKK